MKSLAIAVVGGNWDLAGGKPSGYVEKLSEALRALPLIEVTVYNGGSFERLCALFGGELTFAGAVVWMGQVPNSLPKVRSVKEAYPQTLLVTSKRNNDEYEFQELINRALGMKANLCVDLKKQGGVFLARVYDPLGNVWQEHTPCIDEVARALAMRLVRLRSMTREASRSMNGTAIEVPLEPAFFSLVREYADTFHELVHPAEGVTRFLGNASFREDHGGKIIFVTKRNVDKRLVGRDAFVATCGAPSEICYWGLHKPSVDAPVQIRLYDLLPRIKYMIHAHVYLKDAPMTARATPCGALEEVDEILSVVPDRLAEVILVNLRGHGCLAMGAGLEQLRDLPFCARPMPELMTL